jgi:hypothetical protein
VSRDGWEGKSKVRLNEESLLRQKLLMEQHPSQKIFVIKSLFYSTSPVSLQTMSSHREKPFKFRLTQFRKNIAPKTSNAILFAHFFNIFQGESEQLLE